VGGAETMPSRSGAVFMNQRPKIHPRALTWTLPWSVWVPKVSSTCPHLDLSVEWQRRSAVALSFLYMAFVRWLQLLPLRKRDCADLAIEVVMLRHEVAVLRRQIARPALQPADRALLAGLSRLLSRHRRQRFFVQPPHSFAGIGTLFGAGGRIHGDRDDRPCRRGPYRSCSDWQR
jgi:hypothetical protein